MKFLYLLLLLSLPLLGNEVAVLQELVQITKKNLEEEERLLKALTDFQKKRENFILSPNSPKLATALVRSAIKVEEEIANTHLLHLLSKELLEEVHFFSQVGAK